MRLLFVIKALSLPGGGAERVLSEVTAGLAARGHAVTVISFDPPHGTDFYPFSDGVERVRLDIDHDRPSGAVQMVHRIVALRAMVDRLAPDAAIGFMHSAYIPLSLAFLGTGIPVIGSEHIVYGHYRERPVERALIRLCAPLIYGFTAISEEMRRGFPLPVRQKMTLVPNPVSAAPKARAQLADGPANVVLSVGRLEAQKDHATLIRAFAQVAPAFPNWRLRIVGDGSLRTELHQLIDDLRLGDRASLAGATSDVSSEYLAAQVFAMPSAYESFGLATAEALAHGLPVVGFSDCPGTNELVVHGENGLLVGGPDRAAALAQGLARVMGSPEERMRMGAAGPRGVAAFTPERIVDRWVLLASAASANAPRPA